jgi:ComF family protein
MSLREHAAAMTGLFHHLIHTAFPLLCAFCGVASRGGPICGQCRNAMPWARTICELCGQSLTAMQPAGVVCAACQAKPPAFTKARAPCTYDFPLDTALKAFKFKRQLWYVPALAGMLLPVLEDEFSQCDALVPVPLHRARHALRGFNQATELCRPLRRATGLPISQQVQRHRATRSQAGLTAAERNKNVRNAFSIKARAGCRYPLIVDDVITTGATCAQLATTLLNAGAEKVGVLTVARVKPG